MRVAELFETIKIANLTESEANKYMDNDRVLGGPYNWPADKAALGVIAPAIDVKEISDLLGSGKYKFRFSTGQGPGQYDKATVSTFAKYGISQGNLGTSKYLPDTKTWSTMKDWTEVKQKGKRAIYTKEQGGKTIVLYAHAYSSDYACTEFAIFY